MLLGNHYIKTWLVWFGITPVIIFDAGVIL